MFLDLTNCQTSRKNSKTNNKSNYKRDKSYDNIFNKLFSLFKNHIKQLKNNIAIKKDKLIYIISSSNYANSIVKNIIKHNYSFEQLKSLEDTIIQIKDQSSICSNNIIEEEQNLQLFTEEIKILLKSLDISYKKKYNEYSNIQLNCINNGNDSNLKNDSNYNLYPFYLNNKRNIHKRTNSQDNREKINKQNNSTNKSQISMRSKNDSLIYLKSDSKYKKTNSVFNENRNINFIKIKKNNLSNAQSTNNVEINKKDFLNHSVANNMFEFNIVNYKNLLSKYDEIKKQNEEYEKSYKNLKKQILNYKNIIELLNKQIGNKTILEKTKQISLLNCQVQNLKKQLENTNLKSIGDIHKNNKNLNLKYFEMDNMDTYESDINNNTRLSSYSLKKDAGNCNYLSNTAKTPKKLKMKNGSLLSKMNFNYKDKILEKETNFMITNLKNKIKQYEIEIKNLKEKVTIEIDKNEELNNICQNQKIKFESEISKINDNRSELSKLLYKKNKEIIKLQKDLFSKTKELEKGKNNHDKKDKMNLCYENILKEKDAKQLELNATINVLKEENEILLRQNEKNKNNIKELNNTLTQYEKQLYQKNEEIIKIQIQKINDMKKPQNKDNNNEINKLTEEIGQLKEKIKNNNNEEEINKLKEENEGLKQFVFKMKDKEEKIVEDNNDMKEKISSLKKENEA